MSLVRRFALGTTAAVLTTGALVGVTAAPASATVSGCTYSRNLSVPSMAATCSENQSRDWYLRLVCMNLRGILSTVNGTLVHGPGTGTSLAQCASRSEIEHFSIVEL